VVNLVCAGDHLLRLRPVVYPLRGGGCQTVLEGPAMVLRGYVHCIFGQHLKFNISIKGIDSVKNISI